MSGLEIGLPCPDEDRLNGFLYGEISEDQRSEMETHLSRCSDCRRLVAQVVRAGAVASAETLQMPCAPAFAGPGDLGRYHLLQIVGAGSMGQVFAAYDPLLDRKVAVKVSRDLEGPPDAPLTERFLNEARLLARFSHPNIVNIFDAGEVNGRFYLTMEFVTGSTLTTWLGAAPRSFDEILPLLIEAGRGLAAAHALGLVHCDFKPNNVLITDDGSAKVADFGLAYSPEKTAGKERPALRGTPAYMAPEQLEGRRADARSDQFAFCVAAYEALCGKPPFEGDTLSTRLEAIRAARLRPEIARQLPRRLRAALARGLSADPEARHPTMSSLLRELERQLPASRRQRQLSQISAVAMLLVLGLGAGYEAHSRRVCQAADRPLAGIWDQAQRQAAAAAFLRTELPYAETAWRSASARMDAYVRALGAMQREACEATFRYRDQSDAVLQARRLCMEERAAELRSLADLFTRANPTVVQEAAQAAAAGLGDLRACSAARVMARGPLAEDEGPRVHELRLSLAQVTAQLEAGKTDLALPAAQRLLKEAEALGHRGVKAQAELLIGMAQGLQGNVREAEQSLSRALWLAEATSDDGIAARAATELVLTLWSAQRDAEAEHQGLHAEALLIRGRGLDRERARLDARMVPVLMNRGHLAEALRRARSAVAVAERLGAGGEHILAQSYQALGSALRLGGQLDEGLAALGKARALLESSLGEAHPQTLSVMNNQASQLADQGRFDEAIPLERRAVALFEHGLPRHPNRARALNSLASMLIDAGRPQEALLVAEQALAVAEATIGDGRPSVGAALGNLAESHLQLGHLDQAERLAERAIDLLQRASPDEIKVSVNLHVLGRVLGAQGRFAEACARHRQALEQRLRLHFSDWVMTESHLLYGQCLSRLGDWQQAREQLERAVLLGERGHATELEEARRELAELQAKLKGAAGPGQHRPPK